MLKIAVVDGQGGGIGSLVVKRLRKEFGDSIEITSLGTNSVATTSMMKAGADKGASGENAIAWNSGRVDIITGPISIMLPNAMLGELTPTMATAISSSPAKKILLPDSIQHPIRTRTHILKTESVNRSTSTIEKINDLIRGVNL